MLFDDQRLPRQFDGLLVTDAELPAPGLEHLACLDAATGLFAVHHFDRFGPAVAAQDRVTA